MSLKDLLSPWAATGDKDDTVYNAAKVSQGWIEGEPPHYAGWNWFENGRDNRINDNTLAVDVLRSFPPQGDYEDLCSGFGGSSVQWHDPCESPNALDSALTVRDSCIGWDSDANEPVLYLLGDDDEIYPVTGLWDYDAAPSMGSALAISYASTPSLILSICSDGDYLYVAWTNASNQIVVSQYSLTTFTGDAVWNCNTAVTTSILYGHAMICADATHIAIKSVNVGTFICIIDKTTQSFSSGSGNNTLGAGETVNAYQLDKLVSDGDHVFWIVTDGTDYWLASVKISSPSTSDYSLTAIVSTPSEQGEHPRGILNLGGTGGVVALVTRNGMMYQFNKAEDDIDPLMDVSNFDNPYNLSGEHDVIIGTDGINLWADLLDEWVSESSAGWSLYKVGLGHFGQRIGGSGPPSLQFSRVTISQSISPIEETYTEGKLLYDGQNMLLVRREGHVYRITNPGAR